MRCELSRSHFLSHERCRPRQTRINPPTCPEVLPSTKTLTTCHLEHTHSSSPKLDLSVSSSRSMRNYKQAKAAATSNMPSTEQASS